MQKIRNNEPVSWENVATICKMLNCRPGVIMEYTEEDEKINPVKEIHLFTGEIKMNIIKYPNETELDQAIAQGEPLLVLLSFDGERMIVSQIDEAVEHHILLKKAGLSDTDIDQFFRLVVDSEGADWTFVCPPDYRNITRKDKRIETFYKDGLTVIPPALKELIGHDVEISIPKRYRRHFDMMGDGADIAQQ